MSKAFTKEDDSQASVVVPSRQRALPPGTPNPITRAGMLRLRAACNAALSRGDAAEASHLQDLMATAVETAPSTVAANVMAFGRGAVVKDSRGKSRTVYVVGVDEMDASAGRISWLSPLAEALAGARVGDVVDLETPRGDEELTVLQVLPEAP